MHKSFISVVSPVHPDTRVVEKFVTTISGILQTKFSDYEMILINCRRDLSGRNLRDQLSTLSPGILKNVCIYNFSHQIETHNAIVGGLDNAHGDYVILLDMKFYEQGELIEKLYQRSQDNFDVVYLKYEDRGGSAGRRFLLKLFYNLIRKYSDMELDYKSHSNRLISRRALNRLLTTRSDWNFLIANLSEVSYPKASLITNIPPEPKEKPLYDEIRLAISVLISRTTLLNKLFLYLFVSSTFFSLLVIINALLVRFTGHDIIGLPREYVPGWAFIIIFLAITFNILLLILYFLYIYLNTIYTQVQRRPLYNIESIDKF